MENAARKLILVSCSSLVPRFGETDMHRVLASMLIAVFSLSVFISSVVAADTAEADKMYAKYIHLMHDKRYEQAFDLIVARRKAGDGWAQANLSDWLQPDKALPEMTKLVSDWLNRGAKEGDAEAQYILGMKYLQESTRGDKLGDRFVEAISLLNKAADQKNQFAIFVLSQMSKKALESVGADSRYAGKP